MIEWKKRFLRCFLLISFIFDWERDWICLIIISDKKVNKKMKRLVSWLGWVMRVNMKEILLFLNVLIFFSLSCLRWIVNFWFVSDLLIIL